MPCVRVQHVPVLATILHLLFSEWLAIWTFWLGYYTLLTDSTAYLYLWYAEMAADAELRGAETIGDYFFCVQNEINVASWSLDLNWKGKCVHLDGENLLGYANFACLALCFSLVGGSILFVLVSGDTDICSGKYLANKFDFEKTRFVRYLWLLLLFWVVGCCACTLYVSGTTLRSQVFCRVLQAG